MANLQYNRIATASDFLNQTNEVRDERRDVPLSDVLDSPLYCLKFSEEWKPHIIGAISTLQKWTAWNGADDDTNTGTRQITKLLAQDMTDCGTSESCDISVLLSDDEFFYDEYLPSTIGTTYSNTQTHNAELAAEYDGTPQSIGSSIPVGTPNDGQKNALCYALDRFVALYCSEKICILQSRNFLEVAWDSVVDAAESFYGSVLDQMLGNWSDNLFGCIIDIPTALTVLADAAAQETLACYLLDQLDGGAISESAFNTAIDNAALSLSGNAQKIACVMTEDMAQFVYLNFLEAYNTALNKQLAGDDVPCDCITASFWMLLIDFSQPSTFYRIKYGQRVASGIMTIGYPPTAPGNARLAIYVDDWSGDFSIRAGALFAERVGSNGNGQNDYQSIRGYSHAAAEGASRWFIGTGFLTDASSNVAVGSVFGSNSLLSRSLEILTGVEGVQSGSNYAILKKIVLYGQIVGGLKPRGSVKVSAIPATVATLFP